MSNLPLSKPSPALPRARTFLNPEALLRQIPILPGMIVADFGCGNGYYAVASAAAAGNKGQVYALDILEDALSQTASLARLVGAYNITTHHCNLELLGNCPVPDISCDAVIISGLLHQALNKDNPIREAYRILKTGGRIMVVEWEPDAPFGPPMIERISKEQTKSLLEKYGFRPVKELPAGSFHYAMLYSK